MAAVSEQYDGNQLLSIGHSNHSITAFLQLLQQYSISVLADVRSSPYSRYVPDFNRENLQQALEGNGITYRFLGNELGGRPPESEFYDAEGHVLYSRLAKSPRFLNGIEWLEREMAEKQIVMMCSEENPADCHRHLLIGRVLAERGVALMHIRKDGTLQTHADVAPQETESQGFLFDELEELSWRSIRSALPKNRRKSSSES